MRVRAGFHGNSRTSTFQQQKHIWNPLETRHTELHFHPQPTDTQQSGGPRRGRQNTPLSFLSERKHSVAFLKEKLFYSQILTCLKWAHMCLQNLFQQDFRESLLYVHYNMIYMYDHYVNALLCHHIQCVEFLNVL